MSAVSEIADGSAGPADKSDAGLSGNMGVLELIFTVFAYNAPVVCFLGFIPVAVLLGNGAGTPVMFLFCGAVVALLAVGLLTMSARLKKPGGFYALITAGLGKVVGLSAGFAALMCYFVALISAYVLGGISLTSIVVDIFHGPHIAWWAGGVVMLAATIGLGHFNISFSGRVLSVFLALELILILAYDISVLVKGGAHGIGLASFTPHQIFSGSVSIGFLFGMGIFGGFEATVIFREEVRNRDRTIPIATYGVIALIASIYALTSWCFVNSYGVAAVMDVVTKNTVGAPTDSIRQYTGQFAYDAAMMLLFTSSFALALASHNITGRYVFNLAADGIFPGPLGRAHPRHDSPHRASAAVGVLSAVVVAAVILAKLPEEDLYARFAGLYTYAFIILLVLVALAIGVYLLTDRVHGKAVGPAVAALAALVLMCVTLFLATTNFTLLTGAVGVGEYILLAVVWGTVLLGAGLALYFKRSRVEVYNSIGRQ